MVDPTDRVLDRSATAPTVLVVDHADVETERLIAALIARGFDTRLAPSGADALGKIERTPTDLVLLELDLPDMPGLEVLRTVRARANPVDLPVIVLSRVANRGAIFEAFQLGGNDFVLKPLDVDVCVARVRAHLRVRRVPRVADDLESAQNGGERDADADEARAVIAGRYELGEILGSGTFGVVYRARHRELGDEVALKVLHPEHAARVDSRARFEREARAAWTIKHPNAVTVLDFGIDGDDRAYVVMELLEGVPLSTAMEQPEPFTIARALEVVIAVCAALEAAHALDIVHRDVKPSNVFLASRRGREQVKLLDFGLAELVTGTAKLTMEGWVGTPTYMAPERFTDEPCDGRSDVYSVGVLLHELLAGRAPFESIADDPLALAIQHLHDPPPRLSTLRPDAPRCVDQAVEWAMAKRPEQRPSARELKELLEKARAALDSDAPQ